MIRVRRRSRPGAALPHARHSGAVIRCDRCDRVLLDGAAATLGEISEAFAAHRSLGCPEEGSPC